MPYKKLTEIDNLLIRIAEKKGLRGVHVTWKTNFLKGHDTIASLSYDKDKEINILFTSCEIETIQSGNIERKILDKIKKSIDTSLHTGNKGPEAKPPRTF